jgi:hypothetical protein
MKYSEWVWLTVHAFVGLLHAACQKFYATIVIHSFITFQQQLALRNKRKTQQNNYIQKADKYVQNV